MSVTVDVGYLKTRPTSDEDNILARVSLIADRPTSNIIT